MLPRLHRPLAVAAFALAGLVMASGCGGSALEPEAAASDPTPSAATSPSAEPTPTVTPTTSAASEPADQGGDGDAEDDAPATAGGGVCSDLGAADVAAVVGVQVTGSGVSGGGCKFDQPGARGLSVTVLDHPRREIGGLAGAKQEAVSAIEGEPQDLPGVGTGAFVVTGTMFGGADQQAAGAVEVGDRVISVFLVQRTGMPAAKVRALEVDLLRLVAQKRG